MSTIRWTDKELRDYVRTAPFIWRDDDVEHRLIHEAFHATAIERIGVPVRDRMLAKAGVAVDPEGIAVLARDYLEERSVDSRKRAWLLACENPWEYLADLMTTRIDRVYGKTIGRDSPAADVLEGLAAAQPAPRLRA